MTHIWIRAEERPNEQRVGVTPDGVAELLRAGFQVTLEEDPTRAISIGGLQRVPLGRDGILAQRP
jgi:saccharopine dehydrogenase (NAD+, L-lysine-forming)